MKKNYSLEEVGKMYKVGILNIQGAVEKHARMIELLGHKAVEVRSKDALENIDAIILPGGESTSIGKQLVWYGMMELLQKRIEEGMPIFGTCAGMILLAKEIEESEQYRIGTMDICVKRNAYGSQLDSFETQVEVKGLPKTFPAIFIRAPRIELIQSDKIEILSSFENAPILIKQGNMMAASFHPELTDDPSIHELFTGLLR